MGVTVGEWSGVLREVFGEYRPADRRVRRQRRRARGVARPRSRPGSRRWASQLGRPLKFLVGKPGLDGHSNGAEQIAVRARDAGFEVVYSGIRLTPAQIISAAVEEDVDVVGLSVLSGSHLSVVPDVVEGLRAEGLTDVPVIVGGIIPDRDGQFLLANGVARVFTPKNFEITQMLGQIVDAIEESRG